MVHFMHPIFERLVAELRAWHLFENRKEYPLRWELPGEVAAGHGRLARHLDPTTAPPSPQLGSPAAMLTGAAHHPNGAMPTSR